MKYVLIVMYLFATADGEMEQVKFTTDFADRESCLAALEVTEAKVLSRVEARALTLQCRPLTPWDEPISWNAYMDDVRVAAK